MTDEQIINCMKEKKFVFFSKQKNGYLESEFYTLKGIIVRCSFEHSADGLIITEVDIVNEFSSIDTIYPRDIYDDLNTALEKTKELKIKHNERCKNAIINHIVGKMQDFNISVDDINKWIEGK